MAVKPTTSRTAKKGVSEDVTVQPHNKDDRKIVFFRKEGRKLVLSDAGCEYISSMTAMGCTIDDIADELGISKPTLYTKHNKEKLNEAVKIGQGRLKNTLRMAQMKTAVKGNPAMLIFLGKNYLGQSDNPAGEEAQTSALSGLVNVLKGYKDTSDEDDCDEPPQ